MRLSVALVAPAALLFASALTTTSTAGAAAPTSPTWSELSPPSGPPGLHDASEAYDAANQTIVLFGGQTGGGALSSATWVWNGSTWAQAVPQIQGPTARDGASLAYSQSLNQLILFGGLGSSGPLADTWAWNGQSWVALSPSASPTSREDASMAVDGNGNLVLFGGTGPSSPSAQSSNAVGQSGASPSSTPAVGASDTSASTTLAVLGDTWLWNGSTWTQQTGAQPPARTGATLSWDTTIGATVLFGGSGSAVGTTATPMADTWTWDGSAWTQVVPVTSPPARAQAVADFTTSLGGVLVTTGSGAAGALDDTWSYDGTTWNAVAAATPLASRSDAAAAWDPATQQLVLFGGLDGTGATLSDTVVLTATAPVTATPTPTGGSGGGSGGGGGGGSTTAPSPTTTPGATTSPTTGGRSSTTTAIPRSTATTPAGSPTTVAPAHPTTAADGAGKAGAGTSVATTAPAVPGVQMVHGGSLVTLLGSGFRPGSSITITFHSTPYTVGRVTADASGRFSATVTVPTGAAPGSHHLVATGMSPAGRLTSLVTPIQVVALPGTAGHGTPMTTTLVMVLVAVLIPIGTWCALAFRSRRRSLTAAG